MASAAKPTSTKARGCVGKVRHDTKAGAETQMWSMVRDLGAARRGVNVYRCAHCKGFHVGHRPGNTRRR
jgi:hypothetical protein